MGTEHFHVCFQFLQTLGVLISINAPNIGIRVGRNEGYIHTADVDIAFVRRVGERLFSLFATAENEAHLAEVLLLVRSTVTAAHFAGRNLLERHHRHFESLGFRSCQLESIFFLTVGILHIQATADLLQAVQLFAVHRLAVNGFKHIEARIRNLGGQRVLAIHVPGRVVVRSTGSVEHHRLALKISQFGIQLTSLVILSHRRGNSYQ